MGMGTTVGEEGFPTLHELTEAHIEKAVLLAGGDITQAAKLLGIGRATLYRRYRVTEMTEKAREVARGFRLKQRLDRGI